MVRNRSPPHRPTLPLQSVCRSTSPSRGKSRTRRRPPPRIRRKAHRANLCRIPQRPSQARSKAINDRHRPNRGRSSRMHPRRRTPPHPHRIARTPPRLSASNRWTMGPRTRAPRRCAARHRLQRPSLPMRKRGSRPIHHAMRIVRPGHSPNRRGAMRRDWRSTDQRFRQRRLPRRHSSSRRGCKRLRPWEWRPTVRPRPIGRKGRRPTRWMPRNVKQRGRCRYRPRRRSPSRSRRRTIRLRAARMPPLRPLRLPDEGRRRRARRHRRPPWRVPRSVPTRVQNRRPPIYPRRPPRCSHHRSCPRFRFHPRHPRLRRRRLRQGWNHPRKWMLMRLPIQRTARSEAAHGWNHPRKWVLLRPLPSPPCPSKCRRRNSARRTPMRPTPCTLPRCPSRRRRCNRRREPARMRPSRNWIRPRHRERHPGSRARCHKCIERPTPTRRVKMRQSRRKRAPRRPAAWNRRPCRTMRGSPSPIPPPSHDR